MQLCLSFPSVFLDMTLEVNLLTIEHVVPVSLFVSLSILYNLLLLLVLSAYVVLIPIFSYWQSMNIELLCKDLYGESILSTSGESS